MSNLKKSVGTIILETFTPKKAYVVSGYTETESDFTEWTVGAFCDEQKAKDYVDLLNADLAKHHISENSVAIKTDLERIRNLMDESLKEVWEEYDVEYYIEETGFLDA